MYCCCESRFKTIRKQKKKRQVKDNSSYDNKIGEKLKYDMTSGQFRGWPWEKMKDISKDFWLYI